MPGRIPALLLLALIPAAALCQVRGVDLYQYNYSTISPAFVGVDGMKITALGNLVTMKRGQQRYSGFAGIEGAIGKVGVGLSATTTSDETSSWSVNLPVNYQLRLGETRKLVFGARVTMQHTDFNYQVVDYTRFYVSDSMVNSTGRISQTGYTTAFGVLYKGERFYAGFSVDNPFHSRPEVNYLPNRPLYHAMIGKDFGGKSKVEYSYSIYAMWMEHSARVDLNNSILILKKGIVGFTMQLDGDAVPTVNAGYRFGNVGQVVVSLYSKNNDDKHKKYSGQLYLQFNLRRRPEPA